MKIHLRDDLPFVSLKFSYLGRELEIPNILIDTGSATTMLSADWLEKIGILPEQQDVLYTVRGVGGVEVVFTRTISSLTVGEKSIDEFEIEVGGMDYGFEICGILGMNFLIPAGALIDLQTMTLDFAV
jgi:hypothetical protein